MTAGWMRKERLLLIGLVFMHISVSQAQNIESPGLDTVLKDGITVNNEDIQDVLKILSQFAGLSMFATKAVVGQVSFSFPQDVTVQQVLDSVLPAYGWGYEYDESSSMVTIKTLLEIAPSEDDMVTILQTIAVSDASLKRILPIIQHVHFGYMQLASAGKGEGTVLFVQVGSYRLHYMPTWLYRTIAGLFVLPGGSVKTDTGSSHTYVRTGPHRAKLLNLVSPYLDYIYGYIGPLLFGLLLGYILAVYQRRRRFARLWRHAA